MERLRSALEFGGVLKKDDIETALANFKYRALKSGDHFQSPGKIANEMCFVEQGVLRIYAADKTGNEITKYFVRESQFTGDLASYYSGKPAKDGFQAVVDSEIYTVHKFLLDKLSMEIPSFYIFLKCVTEAQLINKINDNDFLNFGDAKTKYNEFLKRYPSLVLQVPQQYIASYLKITPQSLSRIRRGLNKDR